ncbi:MAG: ABC transporter permease [Thermoanaerobaculia bacterium]|nr:ABC transporter permease [Thermoanaerobaculia bacterium]
MLSQDIRYGLRSFIRRPGSTGLVILILALGIGFVTMILSLAQSIFFGSVPYGDPDRIVVLWRKGPEPIHEREAVSYVDFLDWKEHTGEFFDGLAAYTIFPSSVLRADGAEQVMMTFVDPYFFDTLDVDMTLGRRLAEDDNRPPSGTAVAVLSHGFWSTEYGGDPDIVGRSINLGGNPYEVVGVMAQKTRWLLHEPLDIVVPYRRTAIEGHIGFVEDRRLYSSIAVGRLLDGVAIEQAQAGMKAASIALQQQYPDSNTGIEAHLTSFTDLRTDFGRLNDVVRVLGAGAGLVFLLSCISVTLLLLARFVDRLSEFAVRMALGGGRHRFILQTMAEGLVIALVAGLAGFGLAYLGVQLVFANDPLGLFSFAEVSVDRSVFLTTLLLALMTTLLFGLVPAIRAARINFHDVLRPSGTGSAGGRDRNLLRRGLVILQVAVSVAVLVGSGLMIQSLHAFTSTDYGFDTDDLVYMRMILDGPRYEADDDVARAFSRSLDEKISALPGAEAASLWAPGLPGSSTWFFMSIPEGKESDPSYAGIHTWVHSVSPGAMRKIGLQLHDGRMIDETDRADGLPAVVVSQAIADELWPGERAIGKRLTNVFGSDEWYTVVGVVSDARMRGMGRTHSQMLRDAYFSLDQLPMGNVNVFVRTQTDRAVMVDQVRTVLRDIDPSRALFGVTTMDQSMATDVGEIRFNTILMLLFACAATLLTTLGIYSVMSHSASRRTREIGIRVALGANKKDVVSLVLNQGIVDMTIGIALGVVAALGLSRVMSSLLYEITPTDPIAFALIVPPLLLVAFLATYMPVRKALAVEPSEALRYE